MIRQLKEADRDAVLDYLYQDLNYNIFPIGDIETFGFDKSFQKVYGIFNDAEEYLAVLLRYRENVIYYSHCQFFDEDVLKLLNRVKFDFISGKAEMMEIINKHLINFTKKEMYFCRADKMTQDYDGDDSGIKIVESEEECGMLYNLLSTIEEFGIKDKSKKDFIENKRTSLQMGTSLYIEEDGKMIATVGTTAETTQNAMVVAVATDSDHRNKGYATKLLKALMHYYIVQKQKELCLFYDNPKAGKIYMRLGFEYIGKWQVYVKNKKKTKDK